MLAWKTTGNFTWLRPIILLGNYHIRHKLLHFFHLIFWHQLEYPPETTHFSCHLFFPSKCRSIKCRLLGLTAGVVARHRPEQAAVGLFLFLSSSHIPCFCRVGWALYMATLTSLRINVQGKGNNISTYLWHQKTNSLIFHFTKAWTNKSFVFPLYNISGLRLGILSNSSYIKQISN